ncbi:MAG: mechanosensitive ion channel, partial [Deltaproteobacteria bacterium]|nr:mechanosensitive ion channel [Deltaproteobacteria bacterium]
MVQAVLGVLLLEPTGPLQHLLRILHLPTHLPGDFPQRLATAAVLLVGFWLVGVVAAWAIKRVGDRFPPPAEQPGRGHAGQALHALRWPVRFVMTLIGAYYALVALGAGPRLRQVVSGLVYVVVALVLARAAIALLGRLLSWHAGRLPEPERQRAERDWVPLGRKVAAVFVVATAFVLVLRHFGQNIGGVVAALGLGSLAIGLAAKDILGNMLAGFALLTDRPFTTGDRIRLATGEEGDVLHIGIRSTRIKLVDANLLVVPNSELLNTRVVNLNLPTAMSRAVFDVHLQAAADLPRARTILVGIASGLPDAVADPAPTAVLGDIVDGRVKVTTTFHVREFPLVTPSLDRAREEAL